MAKIAVELEKALSRRARTGEPGGTSYRVLASGPGWEVSDVLCTSGPQDRAFEEQHGTVSIGVVASGSFQYRAAVRNGGRHRELMTPGSLLLGNPGRHFECSHEHAAGDRCIAFRYAPAYFEQLVAEVGRSPAEFGLLRLPAVPDTAELVARACSGVTAEIAPWEELSIRLAVQAIGLANGLATSRPHAHPSAIARVSDVVRTIELRIAEKLSLAELAAEAGLSPYHFLRAFENVAGVTPHQYILRSRLREAAMRLMDGPEKIVEIALDCGFGDVSNFNRNFRTEFGASPRQWRAAR